MGEKFVEHRNYERITKLVDRVCHGGRVLPVRRLGGIANRTYCVLDAKSGEIKQKEGKRNGKICSRAMGKNAGQPY